MLLLESNFAEYAVAPAVVSACYSEEPSSIRDVCCCIGMYEMIDLSTLRLINPVCVLSYYDKSGTTKTLWKRR